MATYYEEIMELWKAGNFLDGIRYYSRWTQEGLVSEEESKGFGKELARFWEFVELECEENPEVVFTLHEMLKKARNWNDGTLSKELEIENWRTGTSYNVPVKRENKKLLSFIKTII